VTTPVTAQEPPRTGHHHNPKDQPDTLQDASPEKPDAQVPLRPKESSEKGRDTVRWVTMIVVAIGFLFLVWYLAADRLTPFTGNARVQAFVVPIVPEVSGYVEAIPVARNQSVRANDVLVQIQRRRFELAVDEARANLDLAGQDVGAGSEGIKTAEAKLAEARTNLEISRIQAKRIISIEGSGAVAQAQVDQARAVVAKREAELVAAEAEVQRVTKQLGGIDADNAQIRAAIAALERARLDLARTTLRAPSNGFVTDVLIDEGYYAVAGQPLMTFISMADGWIEAYLTENNLGNVRPGNRVEITFDVRPGKVFQGEVIGRGYGADAGKKSKVGALPTIQSTRGWLRDPQRFPLMIRITDPALTDENGRYTGGLGLSVGAQADVVVYTGDSFILNSLAAAWIRVASVFSYAY